MTKKTNDAATNDAADLGTAALPDSLVQATTVDDTELEHPKVGGSYTRQVDGSLVANVIEGAEPAKEPGCHFDIAPQGATKA